MACQPETALDLGQGGRAVIWETKTPAPLEPWGVSAAAGAVEDFACQDRQDNSGLVRFTQPAALIALSVGELSAADHAFCRSVMFMPALSIREARRLEGIAARQVRSVGL